MVADPLMPMHDELVPMAEAAELGEEPGEEAEEEPQAHPLASYWAAAPAEEVVSVIDDKRSAYQDVAEQIGLLDVWRIANAQTFGQEADMPGVLSTHRILADGQYGQDLRLRVDEPRSFLRQALTMACGQEHQFQAVCENTDTATVVMAPVIDAAVGHFLNTEMPESKKRALVESDRINGSGMIWSRFDPHAGEEVVVGQQQAPIANEMDPQATAPLDVYGPSGAPVAEIKRPWEYFHEPLTRGRHLWRAVDERRSRYELMSLYPDKAQAIKDAAAYENNQLEESIFGTAHLGASVDDVRCTHWYHVRVGDPNEQNNPLANGRYIVCVGTTVLSDGPLPLSKWGEIPAVVMMSSQLPNVSFGFSDYWSLLALQAGENQIISDILSNATQFARQSMWFDEGTEFDVDAVAAGGGVFVKPLGSGTPGYMTPPAMPQTSSFMVDYFARMKQSVSGLNTVARGMPTANVTSGEMAALFTNQAQEFNSDTTLTLDEAMEATANIFADLVLTNCESEMLVELVGEDSRPYVFKFRPDIMRGVRRFKLKQVPSQLRNPQGRIQMFQMISGLETERQKADAIRIVTTGQFQALNTCEGAQMVRINWENEALARGEAVAVMFTNDPKAELREHRKLYDQLAVDPERNKQAIGAVLKHVQEHIEVWMRADPMTCALLGIEPPPSSEPAAEPEQEGGGGAPKQAPSKDSRPRSALGPKLPEPAKPPAEAGAAA